LDELAAKQEALEEANRLKNQFRSLDEDEIEFLDSVLESTRAEEERVKRETAEGLELFRQQQEDADKKLLARRGSDGAGPNVVQGSPTAEEDQWAVGTRKRKRAKEKEGLKGVKLRKSSTNEQTPNTAKPSPLTTESSEGDSGFKSVPGSDAEPASNAKAKQGLSMPTPPLASLDVAAMKILFPPKGGLGLVDYGSDEDDY